MKRAIPYVSVVMYVSACFALSGLLGACQAPVGNSPLTPREGEHASRSSSPTVEVEEKDASWDAFAASRAAKNFVVRSITATPTGARVNLVADFGNGERLEYPLEVSPDAEGRVDIEVSAPNGARSAPHVNTTRGAGASRSAQGLSAEPTDENLMGSGPLVKEACIDEEPEIQQEVDFAFPLIGADGSQTGVGEYQVHWIDGYPAHTGLINEHGNNLGWKWIASYDPMFGWIRQYMPYQYGFYHRLVKEPGKPKRFSTIVVLIEPMGGFAFRLIMMLPNLSDDKHGWLSAVRDSDTHHFWAWGFTPNEGRLSAQVPVPGSTKTESIYLVNYFQIDGPVVDQCHRDHGGAFGQVKYGTPNGPMVRRDFSAPFCAFGTEAKPPQQPTAANHFSEACPTLEIDPNAFDPRTRAAAGLIRDGDPETESIGPDIGAIKIPHAKAIIYDFDPPTTGANAETVFTSIRMDYIPEGAPAGWLWPFFMTFKGKLVIPE